jgi:hypothetical protein
MHHYIICLILGLFVSPLAAQVELAESYQKAEDKPQFIYLRAASKANIQHRQFNNIILKNQRIGDFLNHNFECFELRSDAEMTQKLIKAHHLASATGILFLDQQGEFIYHQKELLNPDDWESVIEDDFWMLLEQVESLAELKYENPVEIWGDTVQYELGIKQIQNLRLNYNDYAHDLYNVLIKKEELQQLDEMIDLSLTMIRAHNKQAYLQLAKYPQLYQEKLGLAVYDSMAADIAISYAWQEASTDMTVEEILKFGEETYTLFHLKEDNRRAWAMDFLLNFNAEMQKGYIIPFSYLEEVLETRLKTAENKEDKVNAHYEILWSAIFSNQKLDEALTTKINRYLEKLLELGVEASELSKLREKLKEKMVD